MSLGTRAASASGCHLALASFSFHLFPQACYMRNPESFLSDESYISTLSKRVVAEICFAGLLVLSVVEAVVRAIFGIFGYLIGLCCEESTARQIYSYTWGGAKLSLITAYGAGSSLIKNVYAKTLYPFEMPAGRGLPPAPQMLPLCNAIPFSFVAWAYK